MNQAPNSKQSDMQPEYNFSGGIRGKHHEAYKRGNNIVFLDPDSSKEINGLLPAVQGESSNLLAPKLGTVLAPSPLL